MNVMSTETKFFIVKCSINHIIQMQDITHIIVITDTIPATKHIFDILIHPYSEIVPAAINSLLTYWLIKR